MTENSPTCILSNTTSCIQSATVSSGGHHHRHHQASFRKNQRSAQQVGSTYQTSSSPVRAVSPSGTKDQFVPRGSTTESRRCNSLSAASTRRQPQQQQQQQLPAPTQQSTTRARSPVLPSPSNSKCGCSPPNISLLLPPDNIDKEEEGESSSSQKSPKSAKLSGWKTSKFFSKSMTSSDLLKGLKKLSLSSSNNEEQEPKSLKSRITNFKKRSSCGADEMTVTDNSDETEKPKTPVLSGGGGVADTTNTANQGSQKTVQDDGIVCKKEDLKAIICNATKRIPLCSPSKKKRALRQTKSASFEPPPDTNNKKKEPVRRAGSEESRTRKSMPCVERDVIHLIPKLDNNLVAAAAAAAGSSNASSSSSSVVVAPATPQKIETPKTPTVILTQVEEQPPVVVVDPSKPQEACVSTVKWDECEVVDAVLIGDAIESFLKGSMTSSDKKVAFRKNSCERKKS